MQSAKVLQSGNNEITLERSVVIPQDMCVSFDMSSFYTVRQIRESVYLVKGPVPDNVSQVFFGYTATSTTGTRFLTPSENAQRALDEAEFQANKGTQSMSSEEWLFSLLTEVERDLLISVNQRLKSKKLCQGFLRLTVTPALSRNSPWLLAFVDELQKEAVLTPARAAAVKTMTPP